MPPKRKTVEAAAEANAHADTPAGNTPANSNPRFASAPNLNDNSTPDLGPNTTSLVEPARSKRQRVSRACDQCRAAREKCDGIQPACFPCVSQGRSCTYQANPKKRGVQTGYIRTLELALAWMFENVASSEDALHNLLVHESGQGGALLVGKDSPAAERLHARWGRSRVNKTVTRLLSGQAAQDPSDDGPSPSQGLSVEDAGQNIPDLSHVPESSFSAPATAQTRTQPGPFLPLISANTSETNFQPDGRTHLPSTGIGKLPPNHWRLLDIYFSYTHSWLPVLEKKDMYQALYQYSEQGLLLPSANVESGVHAELWSALALASFQAAAAAASTSGSPAPAVYGGGNAIDPSPTDIFDTARKLIPSESGPFQVQHCRALLLLCLVHLGRDDWESAWLLVGFAIRVLLVVRTQSLPNDDQLQARMRALLVACFILDTIVSVRRNVPAHLKPDDVADLPLPEDGQDQWEPWTPCESLGGEHTMLQMLRNPAYPLSTFNHLYGVTKLVALELLPRMRMSSQNTSLEFRSRLQQVIGHNSPFGVFILSQDTASAFVPTAYLTRTFYLWAAAFSEPVNDHFSHLLIETLDQYQKRFGTYAIPPLVPTLLASLIASKEQSHCSERHRRQLKEMLPAYCLIWSKVGRQSDDNSQPIRQYEPPSTAAPNANANPVPYVMEQPPSTSICQANGRFIGLPNPTPYNGNTVPDTVAQTDGPRHYGSTNARGILTAYPPPTTHLVEAAMALTHGGAPPRPPPPPTAAAYVDNTTNDPPHPHNLVSMAHFGYSTVEYDAMVDDLASIEYTDAVDVDPQFMTNLGFVPGCNFSDINTYEQ